MNLHSRKARLKNKDWKDIKNFFSSKERTLVVTHFSPDGDAVGSLLAMGGILEYFQIPFVLAIDDPCPAKYSFIPGYDEIVNLKTDPIGTPYSRMIILDAGSMSRIGSAVQCRDENTVILNIDHHYTGEKYGTLNLVDTDAVATAELLHDLIQFLKIPMTAQIACGLYVGILTDTGRFRFSNTNAKAFRICGDLVAFGINPSLVTENVFYNMQPEVLKSLSWSLSGLELHFNGMLSMLVLDYSHTVSDSQDFVEYGSSINGVAISVFIHEIEPEVLRVSIRSRCRVNVSDIAKRLGGGGHLKAAGFRYDGTIADLKTCLLKEVRYEITRHGLAPGEPFLEMPPDTGSGLSEWVV